MTSTVPLTVIELDKLPSSASTAVAPGSLNDPPTSNSIVVKPVMVITGASLSAVHVPHTGWSSADIAVPLEKNLGTEFIFRTHHSLKSWSNCLAFHAK